jgi:hypothetical protein
MVLRINACMWSVYTCSAKPQCGHNLIYTWPNPLTLWKHKNFYLMLKKTHFLVSEKIKLSFLKQKFKLVHVTWGMQIWRRLRVARWCSQNISWRHQKMVLSEWKCGVHLHNSTQEQYELYTGNFRGPKSSIFFNNN